MTWLADGVSAHQGCIARMTELEERALALEDAMRELCELGELWLERRAMGKDTTQIANAIGQVTAETRKLERKLGI